MRPKTPKKQITLKSRQRPNWTKVCLLLPGLIGMLLTAVPVFAIGDSSKLAIPQIQYRGGDFKPRPKALESLLAQVAKRTSVEVRRDSLEFTLDDPRLFHHPFLYMGGTGGFEPFNKGEIKALRDYLNYGGFLLIDDNSPNPDSGFDGSVRKMIDDLYPHTPFQKIGKDHSIFRSFYLINEVGGRVQVNPYLEGITVKGKTVIVYSRNDLAGAWSKNKLGHYNFDMIGSGPKQRTQSIRLGVNIIMYSLTLDYKKDLVHLPTILERLRRYNSR